MGKTEKGIATPETQTQEQLKVKIGISNLKEFTERSVEKCSAD